jgi:hypothetical protein
MLELYDPIVIMGQCLQPNGYHGDAHNPTVIMAVLATLFSYNHVPENLEKLKNGL